MLPKYIFLFFFILFFMGCELSNTDTNHTLDQQLEKKVIQVGKQNFTVEIANTDLKRQKGLMNREKLESGTGMLFIFDTEDTHTFWMKNTLIPLDIAWISSDNQVVDIQTMTPCEKDPCALYKSKAPAQFVLEVNQGELKATIGDQFKIQ